MVFGELALFPNVDEHKLFAAIHPGFDRVNCGFTHSRLGVVDNLEKARGMLVGHGGSLFIVHAAKVHPTKCLRSVHPSICALLKLSSWKSRGVQQTSVSIR